MYTDEQIWAMMDEGKSHRQINAETGISVGQLSVIRNRRKQYRTAVIAQDFHFPYQDDIAVQLFLDFIARERPDEVILLGDICDFYAISSFDRNPKRSSPMHFARELVETRQFLAKVRQACPSAKIVFVKGNHEDRMRRYLWKKAPELDWGEIADLVGIPEYDGLPRFDITSLFGLQDHDIHYEDKGYWFGGLLCTHGAIVRKHAGYTARAEFERNGCNGISGHTHRDGKYTVRNQAGQFVWCENYCMCDLEPEYAGGDVMNWAQGFSLAMLVSNSPRITQIPICDGGYVYGGNLYVGDVK